MSFTPSLSSPTTPARTRVPQSPLTPSTPAATGTANNGTGGAPFSITRSNSSATSSASTPCGNDSPVNYINSSNTPLLMSAESVDTPREPFERGNQAASPPSDDDRDDGSDDESSIVSNKKASGGKKRATLPKFKECQEANRWAAQSAASKLWECREKALQAYRESKSRWKNDKVTANENAQLLEETCDALMGTAIDDGYRVGSTTLDEMFPLAVAVAYALPAPQKKEFKDWYEAVGKSLSASARGKQLSPTMPVEVFSESRFKDLRRLIHFAQLKPFVVPHPDTPTSNAPTTMSIEWAIRLGMIEMNKDDIHCGRAKKVHAHFAPLLRSWTEKYLEHIAQPAVPQRATHLPSAVPVPQRTIMYLPNTLLLPQQMIHLSHAAFVQQQQQAVYTAFSQQHQPIYNTAFLQQQQQQQSIHNATQQAIYNASLLQQLATHSASQQMRFSNAALLPHQQSIYNNAAFLQQQQQQQQQSIYLSNAALVSQQQATLPTAAPPRGVSVVQQSNIGVGDNDGTSNNVVQQSNIGVGGNDGTSNNVVQKNRGANHPAFATPIYTPPPPPPPMLAFTFASPASSTTPLPVRTPISSSSSSSPMSVQHSTSALTTPSIGSNEDAYFDGLEEPSDSPDDARRRMFISSENFVQIASPNIHDDDEQ